MERLCPGPRIGQRLGWSMPIDEAEPVPTERVTLAISSPLLHERDVEAPVSIAEDADLEFGKAAAVPVVVQLAMSAHLASVATIATWGVSAATGIGAAAATGIGAAAATGDPRVGLALAGIVGLAVVIRSADRRLPFSFGEGFVGYRTNLGWPRGVQEDDDVHWSWRATRQPSGR